MARVVIKVGSNVITGSDERISDSTIERIAHEIVDLKRQGHEVLLVTSGAVAAGRSLVKLKEKSNPVTKRQVWSAVGQIELMAKYRDAFGQHEVKCAQVLATKEDFRDRSHYLHMKQCLISLLRDDIVPIINENDVIAIEELMFTDNDELSGLISGAINANMLILLSSVDGVLDEAGRLIANIHPDDNASEKYVKPGKSTLGRGGMQTKIKVAQQAAKMGIETYIANGLKTGVVKKILSRATEGTRFPSEKNQSPMKKWLAWKESGSAQIIVNQGAAVQLMQPNRAISLLPVGIEKVIGKFKKGDIVEIYNPFHERIGIGKARYSAKKLLKRIGKRDQPVFIHYDYLLTESTK